MYQKIKIVILGKMYLITTGLGSPALCIGIQVGCGITVANPREGPPLRSKKGVNFMKKG